VRLVENHSLVPAPSGRGSSPYHSPLLRNRGVGNRCDGPLPVEPHEREDVDPRCNGLLVADDLEIRPDHGELPAGSENVDVRQPLAKGYRRQTTVQLGQPLVSRDDTIDETGLGRPGDDDVGIVRQVLLQGIEAKLARELDEMLHQLHDLSLVIEILCSEVRERARQNPDREPGELFHDAIVAPGCFETEFENKPRAVYHYRAKAMRYGLQSLLAVVLVTGAAPSYGLEPLWPDAESIEHFLKEADVTEREKIGTGVTHPEKVTLELDGVVRHAVFKKVDENYDSWRAEVAAYQLDKLLHLGMVPPTVERRIGGRKGCLQLWVTGVTMKDFDGTFPDIQSWRDQVSVMWLFDDLTANIDRHLNNAIVSKDYRLVLIDNSKTFRYEKKLLNDLNAKGTGTNARFWGVEYDEIGDRYPTRYPRGFIEQLRSLTDKEINKAIKKYIWGYAGRLVRERRKLILERLDSMGEEVLFPGTELDEASSSPSAAPASAVSH
jgi:hypothetical protein